MKRKIVAVLLIITLIIPIVFQQKVSAMSVSDIRAQINNTYTAACAKAGVSSFNGYCAWLVNWELVILGINSSYIGGNGNDEYDNYKDMAKSSGGYYISAYPASSYNLKAALHEITDNGTKDAYNILVGFETGSGNEGALYGHVVFIHGIIDGTVYFCESFNATIGGNYYSEGSVIACSIAAFASYYDSWTTLDGVIHFQEERKQYTVIFDANGGICSTDSCIVVDGSRIEDMPYPTREGFIFYGWYTSPSGGDMFSTESTVSGNITLYARWSSDYEDLGAGFYGRLTNIYANLGIVNSNGNVELGEGDGERSIWYFERYPEGCYSIMSVVDGTVMDVCYGDTEDGTNIWTYEKNDTLPQKWFIRKTDTGYIIISKETGKALDINGCGVEQGTNAQLWTLNGTGAQLVDISEVYPIMFDANGGVDAPDRQWKQKDADLILTDAIPACGGIRFAGWSLNRGSTQVDYTPGDIFTDNCAVTLYAVWECTHSYTAKVTKEATSTTAGTIVYTCSLCQSSYSDSVPALEHDYKDGCCTLCGQKDESVQKGDINGDGVISSSDAVLLAEYLVDLTELNETQLQAADINGDGLITSSDSVQLARFLVGLCEFG